MKRFLTAFGLSLALKVFLDCGWDWSGHIDYAEFTNLPYFLGGQLVTFPIGYLLTFAIWKREKKVQP